MRRTATLAAQILSVVLSLLLVVQVLQPSSGNAYAAGPGVLTVSKTVRDLTSGAGPATAITAAPGDTLMYQLNYSITGTSTATGLTLSDTLTGAQTYVTGSCAPTPCTGAGSTVTFGPSDTGPTGTGTFEVTVNPGATGTLTNTFTANATNATGPATSSATTVTIATPTTTTTLAATKTVQNTTTGLPAPPAATATAAPGQSLRFFLNYANTGTVAANVTLTDPLPAGAVFVGCAPAPCGLTGTTVTFGPYATAAGAGGQATLDVTVANSFTGTMTNTFTASAANAAAVASSATVFVAGTVLPSASISVEKQVADVSRGGTEATGTSALPGDTVRYFLAVSDSAGYSAATGVVITDTLQPGQTFANHCSVPCTFDGVNTVSLTIGNVTPGGTVYATFDAVVGPGTTGSIIQNTATAAGTNTNGATSNTTSIVVGTGVGCTSSCGGGCGTSCYTPPVSCPYSCYYTPPYFVGNPSCGTFYACNGCSTYAYYCVGSAYSRTLTICGTVQTYQAPTTGTAGFITINGEAFILMPSMIVSGGTIATGSAFCFTMTINGYCQVTSVVVSPNVAAANYVCGTVTPFTQGYWPFGGYAPSGYLPYTGYNPNVQYTQYGPYQLPGGYYGYNGPLVIGGYPYQVASNFQFPFNVSYGNPYCFLVNQAGAVNGSLSVVPTAAAAVESPTGTKHLHRSGSV